MFYRDGVQTAFLQAAVLSPLMAGQPCLALVTSGRTVLGSCAGETRQSQIL